MKSKKIGFTLIEVLISIMIIGILVVILFRAYNTISQVTFRAQQEKSIQQETLWAAQTLQNIADKNTIARDVSQSEYQITLSGTNGLTILTSTGACLENSPPITIFTGSFKSNPCQLIIIDKNNKVIPITSSGEVILSRPHFKLFPQISNQSIISGYQGLPNQNPPFLDIRQPAFQISFTIYTPGYQKTIRFRKSSLLFEQFFNLQS